jgi:predicted ATPase/DNA-binding SARP family transcriptional activator
VFQISVLGPIEVRRGGQLVRVPGGKASEVLVRLAVEAGELVRTDRLVDDLWAAEAVTTRRNTLQSKIARLRRALGASVIASGDGGYTLAVEPSDVDALAVLRRTVAASRLLDAGDDRGADDLCASTLQMYRGEVLQAAGDGEWVTPHRARLVEARMKLVETQLSARLRIGDAGDVIGELEAALATYPFAESLWELLITALYRAGRQTDALATYQRVRQLLGEELGLDPGPQLQQLEQRILVHDASLGVPDRMARLDLHASAGNLPSMSVDLVGRQSELADLCDLLAAARLVEIVGPGGIGKTAIALATGRTLTDLRDAGSGGVWLARLEAATTADEVVDALIAALNVIGGEAALFERLKSSSALVILDNCEHVIDEAADLAARLLDAAPRLQILCTSQVPLGVDGETVFELAPLALSDAMELFTRRASTRRRNQLAGAADDVIRELCRSLDGLPLAIELAAARTRTLSIEEITQRLDDRFNVLSDPTSRKPERRRALRATIGWSYELLFPDDKRGLWALAAFAGGAPLSAVEFVLEALEVPASTAIDVIGRLASRSLVSVDDDDPSLPVRYRLLDSIRAFALEAMSDEGLTERALAAHAEWFADAAASSTQGVRSSAQAEHLSFARTERANIDAALAWSAANDPPLAVDIVNGFGWAWIVLGDSRGAQRILTALDAAGETAPDRDRAVALLLASWIEASTGDLELARDHIARAGEIADALHDIDLQARCCYYLAYVVSHHGEWEHASELTSRSRALYAGLDRPWDQAANALFASRAAISAGDEGRSLEAAAEVEQWLGIVEDPWLHVRRDAMLGELARIQHRYDDAVHYIARAAETSQQLGFRQTEAYQLSSLGRAQCQAGDYETGAATLELAIEKAEATGDLRLAALARVHLGRVLRALGRMENARDALDAASSWHRSVGGGEQYALGECLLAAMNAADGQPGALDRLSAILEEAQRNGDAHVEVFALDALARSAADAGDYAGARTLREAADDRFTTASHFITERDRVDAR